MSLYFVQFKSITDNQKSIKTFSTLQSLDNGKQYKYICTTYGHSGQFSSFFQSGRADIDCILQKSKQTLKDLLCTIKDPIPSHKWGDCFNNLKNKTSEGQHNNNNLNKKHHNRHRNYSFPRGQRRGHRCGCGSCNVLTFPIHFQHNKFNKLLQMFHRTHCPQ
jgi:hypothetical protein